MVLRATKQKNNEENYNDFSAFVELYFAERKD